jgi:hypothetical protein
MELAWRIKSGPKRASDSKVAPAVLLDIRPTLSAMSSQFPLAREASRSQMHHNVPAYLIPYV